MSNGWYTGVGGVLGVLAGILTFFGCWIYCIASFGFILGLGLGWIPSGFIALIVGGVVTFLWLPGILLIGAALMAIYHAQP